jgi:hypothetical protein
MQHKCRKGIYAVLKKGADYQLKMQAKIRHTPRNTFLRVKVTVPLMELSAT